MKETVDKMIGFLGQVFGKKRGSGGDGEKNVGGGGGNGVVGGVGVGGASASGSAGTSGSGEERDNSLLQTTSLPVFSSIDHHLHHGKSVIVE